MPPLAAALSLCWTLVVLAGYLPDHPSLGHVEWFRPAVWPPCWPASAPWFGERMASGVGIFAMLSLTNLGWLAAGRRIGDLLRSAVPAPGRLLIGMGAAAVGWLGLGLTGLWHPAVAWTVAVLPVAGLRGETLRRGWAALRAQPLRPGPVWFAAMVLVAGWVTLAGALAPELEFDPLRYHLGLADHYVRIHRVVFRERFIFASFPLNCSMLFGHLKLLGGDRAAKLLNGELLWVLARQAWTLAGGGAAGRWTVAALLAVPLVWVHATMGFAELLLANALTAALGESLAGRPAASGLLAGVALGTKYQALQGVLPILAGWAWRGGRRRLRPLGIWCALACMMALPWAVKNWWFTGNPVHPLWSGVLPDLEDAARALDRSRFTAAEVLGGHGITAWLAAPWTVLVRGDRATTYPFGPAVILLLPWALLAVGGSRPARFALGFVLLWAATTAGWNRYLIAALPALFVAGWAGFPAGPGRALFAVVLVLGQVLGTLTIFQRQSPLGFAGGCEDAAGYLMARAPFHLRCMREATERLAKGERYYPYGELVTYYAGREGLPDYESDTPLIQLLVQASPDAAALRRRLRQRGIAAILYNQPGAVTASAVAEMRPWTARDVRVYQEFFRTYAAADWRLERERENEYAVWYRLRRAADPAARLPHGTLWTHLPGLEPVLADADATWARGDRAGALRAYRLARDAHPEYAWAHQRVADAARDQGLAGEARRALAAFRRLGG